MKRKKRSIIILFLTVVLLVVFTIPSVAQKTLKGRVSIWGGYYLNNLTKYVMETVFLKDHPEIKIEYSSYPYLDYPIKMKMALSAHSPDPDIMTLHNQWITDFYVHGHLMDLTSKLVTEKQNYLPWIWKAVIDSNGKIWGVPFEAVFSVFYYRRDIYDEYGLSLPKTRKDFIENGQKIKEHGQYASFYNVTGGDREISQEIAGISGLDFFNSKGKVVLDTPEGKGIYSAELIKELIDTGFFWPFDWYAAETKMALEEGKIVSFIGPNCWAKSFRDNTSEKAQGFGEWRISVPPQLVDDPVTDLYGEMGIYLVVSEWSDNKDLAWEVVKWFKGTIEGDKSTALKDAVMGAYIPALEELAAEDTAFHPLFGDQPIVKDYAKMLLTYSMRMLTPNVFLWEAQLTWTEELAEMVAGNKTPEQAMKDAADRIRKSIGR